MLRAIHLSSICEVEYQSANGSFGFLGSPATKTMNTFLDSQRSKRSIGFAPSGRNTGFAGRAGRQAGQTVGLQEGRAPSGTNTGFAGGQGAKRDEHWACGKAGHQAGQTLGSSPSGATTDFCRRCGNGCSRLAAFTGCSIPLALLLGSGRGRHGRAG